MSSTWRRELSWFLHNYLLLNALAFVVGLAWGMAMLVMSSDRTIPGWSGSVIQQVASFAVSVVFYGPLILGMPVLVVAMLAWRLATVVVRDARLAAYLVAAATFIVAVIVIPRVDVAEMSALLGLPLMAYTGMIRKPDVTGAATDHRGAYCRILGVVVALALVGIAVWWWTENTLSPDERAWCAEHAGDVASWTYSTALEGPFSEAQSAERLSNRDPWESDKSAIIRACKGAYSSLHDTNT